MSRYHDNAGGGVIAAFDETVIIDCAIYARKI